MARRRVGRVRVAFDVIERFAAEWKASGEFAPEGDGWTLSRASSLHRRKDGSITLNLIWKAGDGQFAVTVRGLRLETERC